ncbi:glycosyltransferase family A protein [Paracoccus ravus]|uniref:glycosyltransferase family A protein n=1 Tax=Paracoccus ravus TaxID=2447760 RepID=UPI00106ED113|nr:glycosyltransferase family A protein [Paracoccus ravus]
MTVPLVFVIPVRHPASVKDWTAVQFCLAQTLASVAAQTVSTWQCVVVANAGSDLPVMPLNARVVWVNLPLPEMPDRNREQERFYDAVRRDKGLRIHAGLEGVGEDAFVMVVDFDDFVHRRLAEFVAAELGAPGWTIDRGYVWGGGSWCFEKPGFHMLCGTSHIIRRALLGRFLTEDGRPDMMAIKRRLGSHVFIHDDLATQGQPLGSLPFAGAVYRVGNPQSTSGNGNLARLMTPRTDLISHPRRFARNVLRYRRVSHALRRDFTLPFDPW